MNTWGLDQCSSLQRAGGVGGLLTRTSGGTTHSYTYDGNGNVSELVSSAGTSSAHYEYGPSGLTTFQTIGSSVASANPYRFSTKPLDEAGWLYYYGYRFYSPIDGRWINRDPMDEQGGMNLYGFVGNSSTSKRDMLGLADVGLPGLDVVVYARDKNGNKQEITSGGYQFDSKTDGGVSVTVTNMPYDFKQMGCIGQGGVGPIAIARIDTVSGSRVYFSQDLFPHSRNSPDVKGKSLWYMRTNYSTGDATPITETTTVDASAKPCEMKPGGKVDVVVIGLSTEIVESPALFPGDTPQYKYVRKEWSVSYGIK